MLRIRRDALLLFLLATAAGCDRPPDEIPRARCSGTLTGALDRTFSYCSTFDQLYRQNLDTLLVTGSYEEISEGSGAAYTANFHLEHKGEPRDGRTAEPVCNIGLTERAVTWLANKGPGVPIGTCRVSFSEVVPYKQLGNTITYCILRGRVQARLEPDPRMPPPEPTPPVDFTLDFDMAPSTDDQFKQRQICEKAQM